MIKTEPFQLGPSDLVHILFMARGQTLLIFKVMGQRSRSRYTLLLNLVNMIQTEPFQPGQSNLVHILLMIREDDTYCFQDQGSKVNVTHYSCC